MKKYIKLLRAKHYIKNLLICLPAFFALSIFDYAILIKLFLGFICFSLTASFIYIVNDIKDIDKDRLHEEKCKRPIAAGEIPIRTAIVIAIILLVTGVSIAIIFFDNGNRFMETQVYIIVYIIINLGYSLGLKNIPIMDVFILASGFVLRVLYGAAITGIVCSNWLLLTVITISLYLGLGKRYSELKNVGNSSVRKVLHYYSLPYLKSELKMCETLGVVFYALWSAEVAVTYYGGSLIWTTPAILGIVMRYNMNLELSNRGDPVEVVFQDKVLLGLIGCYVFAMCIIFYFVH